MQGYNGRESHYTDSLQSYPTQGGRSCDPLFGVFTPVYNKKREDVFSVYQPSTSYYKLLQTVSSVVGFVEKLDKALENVAYRLLIAHKTETKPTVQ